MAEAMSQQLVHVIAVVGLFTEVVHVCHCEEPWRMDTHNGTPAPANTADQEKTRPDGEPEDVTPGVVPPPSVLHWIIAVILTFVLIGVLVRVYRVLHGSDSMALIRNVPEGMRPVECGACHVMQYVTTHGRIFICFSCNSANRIPVDIPRGEQQELVAPTGPLRSFEFKKGGENYWQELRQEEIEGSAGETPVAAVAAPSPSEANRPVVVGRQMENDISLTIGRTDGSVSELPQCAVCLDSPGRMVLLPCAHGGVCEECVTRIAQNRASGGAHCPHCRSTIHTLVKIHEIAGDLAKGIEYRIPIARAL